MENCQTSSIAGANELACSDKWAGPLYETVLWPVHTSSKPVSTLQCHRRVSATAAHAKAVQSAWQLCWQGIHVSENHGNGSEHSYRSSQIYQVAATCSLACKLLTDASI